MTGEQCLRSALYFCKAGLRVTELYERRRGFMMTETSRKRFGDAAGGRPYLTCLKGPQRCCESGGAL